MEQCLFCPKPPSGKEHVFLSALGGKLATRHATCPSCNNHFATAASNKIDDALAQQFLLIRCALAVWGDKNHPPPTIQRAGTMPNGAEYDLAPGFVPVLRASLLPKKVLEEMSLTVSVRDAEQARKYLSILKARGYDAQLMYAAQVRVLPGSFTAKLELGGQEGFRSMAKTALVGACILYGNQAVRASADPGLVQAVYSGARDIRQWAGWDYTNPWPGLVETTPHPRSPLAVPSGFEHSLVVSNIAGNSVAYVEVFGGFRFTVRLGPSGSFEPRGLAVNPLSPRPARFVLQTTSPNSYLLRTVDSSREEFKHTAAGVSRGLTCVLEKWSRDAHQQYYAERAADLQVRLDLAGDDDALRQKAIVDWAEEIAAIKAGKEWAEEINSTDIDREIDEE